MKSSLLFLKKENTVIIINDWPYKEFIPTTYYHRCGLLKIEVYDLEYTDKNGNGYYKLMEIRES